MDGNYIPLEFQTYTANLSNLSTTSNILQLQKNSSLPYYGDQLKIFRSKYTEIHGYLSVIVCLFGIITSILNIIVLTRKNIISSTSIILTSLAVADMSIMVTYAPYVLHDYIIRYQPESITSSCHWARYILFRNSFNAVCHTISSWLTVTLAIWRFLIQIFPLHSRNWCTIPRAKIAIFCNYFFCILCCLPIYFTFGLASFTHDSNIFYIVSYSSLAKRNKGFLVKITFWIYSVFTKLIPCIILTCLSVISLNALYKVKRKQKTRHKDYDKVTGIILAIVLFFLITMVPNGILALLSGILGDTFLLNVYMNLRELLDLLALINCSMNFVLYSSMNKHFRQTLINLFTSNVASKDLANHTITSNTTNF